MADPIAADAKPQPGNAKRKSCSNTFRPVVALLAKVVKHVTVEPVLFLYVAGWNLVLVVVGAGLYWKVCMQQFGLNETANCSDSTYPKHVEDFVQKETATWSLYENLAAMIPLIIAGPLFGALGDRFGRKITLVLGLFGVVLYGALYFLELLFVELPLYLIPACFAVIVFLGYGANVVATCYAYVADITLNEKDLTFRYTLLEVVCRTADILFGFASAMVLAFFSYANAMLLGAFVWLLAIVYSLCFLRLHRPKKFSKASDAYNLPPSPEALQAMLAEIRLSNADLKEKRHSFDLLAKVDLNAGITRRIRRQRLGLGKRVCFMFHQLCQDFIQTAFKPREDGKRLAVWLCIFSSFLLKVAEAGWMVLHLFSFHSPINWTGYDVSIFYGGNAILNAFGTLFGSFVLNRFLRLHETTIILISVASGIGQCIWTGLSGSGLSIYLAAAVGLVSMLHGPAMKSLVTQFIEKDEIGKTLTLLCQAGDVGWMVAVAVSNSFYAATVDFYPGLVYFAGAGLMVLGVLPICYLHFVQFMRDRKSKRHPSQSSNSRSSSLSSDSINDLGSVTDKDSSKELTSFLE